MRSPRRLSIGFLLVLLSLGSVAPVATTAAADTAADPREIQIHDLEGHWYLLKLSVDEFKTSAAVEPPTVYDRREIYKTGLHLRSLCRQHLGSAEELLRGQSSIDDDFWYRSRLQVVKRSLRRAVGEIELELQRLEPGPIIP